MDGRRRPPMYAGAGQSPYSDPSFMRQWLMIQQLKQQQMMLEQGLQQNQGQQQNTNVIDTAQSGKQAYDSFGSIFGGAGSGAAAAEGTGLIAGGGTAAAAGGASMAGTGGALSTGALAGNGLYTPAVGMMSSAGGAGAGAGGAAGSGAAAGTGSTLGSAASVAWPLAIAVTAYMSGKNYLDARKKAKGGNMTSKETQAIEDPWRKYTSKLPKELERPAYMLSPHGITQKLLGGVLGSTKDDGQILRDRVRKTELDNKFLNDKYQFTNALGQTTDMGLDGGAKLQNFGKNIDGGTTRHAYDVDWSNQLSGKTVGMLNALGLLHSGSPDQKVQSDTVGMLTNAALNGAKSEADARSSVADMYRKSGFNSAADVIKQLESAKQALGDKYDAYVGGVNDAFSAPIPTTQSTPGVAPLRPGMTPAATANMATGRSMVIPRTGRHASNYVAGPRR